MGAAKEDKKLVVMHAPAAWGDSKPFIALAVYIVEARPDVTCIILTVGTIIHGKFMRELDKLPPSRRQAVEPQIHIVDIVGRQVEPKEMLGIQVEFFRAFNDLYHSRKVSCLAEPGKIVENLPRIAVAIVDPFCGYAVDSIRKISGPSPPGIPILSWNTASAGAFLHLFGPEKYGGMGEVVDILKKHGWAGQDNFGLEEWPEALAEIDQMFSTTTGKVVQIPGCPPMYDYEWHPQATVLDSTPLFTFAHIHTRSTEGGLVVSSSAYEEEAIKGWKAWFKSMKKPLYAIGPLSLPEANWKNSPPTEKESMVIDFLDRMQQRFGEKSLIYVSFGTVFFPADPSKVWVLLDELIANQVPFIFAHTSEVANVPDDKKKLIAESGIGLEMKWAPQEVILKHPATGWFISHGGWNSVQEAFVNRTPMIYWPISADQPYNAALMTLRHKAGFELLEVRTSSSGLPGQPFRCKDGPKLDFTVESARKEIRALLDRLRGEEGRAVRKNCEQLSEKMGRTWDEDGESRKNLREFLSRFIDDA
ncbi:hypothetical protein VKT23_007638 [Stygiomarasmius scandens]|uniref:UDP-Glycosyltransferase/glycogen phosphorylase n=1 Tax=Marasmiellus scandens TaxID=2682957 RepID=A0ABR1JNM9_9AGAR